MRTGRAELQQQRHRSSAAVTQVSAQTLLFGYQLLLLGMEEMQLKRIKFNNISMSVDAVLTNTINYSSKGLGVE